MPRSYQSPPRSAQPPSTRMLTLIYCCCIAVPVAVAASAHMFRDTLAYPNSKPVKKTTPPAKQAGVATQTLKSDNVTTQGPTALVSTVHRN